MKVRFSYILLLLASFAGVYQSLAQCSPTAAPDSVQFITNDPVLTTAMRGNVLYLGGNFTSIGKYTGHFTAIDTLTGKLAAPAGWPKVNGIVRKILDDGSGGWYICGQFSRVGDSVRNNIARINGAGQVTGWKPIVNGDVWCMERVNNKLYICGGFTNVNSTVRNRVAAVDINTAVLTSWNPNVNDTVFAIAYYGGRIYIGGRHIYVNGTINRQLVSQLDTLTGAPTAWNAHAYGGIGGVRTFAFRGATVYIGGGITNIGTPSRPGAAALDTGTAALSPWNPASNGVVYKILLSDTTAYIGGSFNNVLGSTRRTVAEVGLSTGALTAFDPLATAYGYYASTNDILVSGNRMYIGGDYPMTYDDDRRLRQIDLTADTLTKWESYADSAVNTMSMRNGALYIGGNFRCANAYMRSRLAAIDMDQDTITAWNPRADDKVMAIVSAPGGIYVGGYFQNVHFNYYHHAIAALDAVTGDTLAGFNARVQSYYGNISALQYHAGILYAGGSFGDINGITRYSLAAVDALTGSVTSWNPSCLQSPGSQGYVYQLTNDGTNMYVNGYFSALAGAARDNMGAVSMTTGAATSWYPVLDGYTTVNTFACGNGNIYMGGNYNHCNGVFTPWLTKMNLASGVTSATWTPYPNAQVNFVKPYLNFLFIAGNFSTIHAATISRMGITDTGTNLPDPWNPQVQGDVKAVEVYNNKMYMAGDIQTAEGKGYYKNLVKYNFNTHSGITTITGPDSVCTGATATYNVTSTAPGATFEWRVNGVAAGTGTSYTYTPANGDQVLCVAIAVPGSCYSPDSAISNIKVITVNPHVTISGPASVCAGVAVTDTAFAAGTGITYQWRVNGAAAGSGSTHTYVPANGDHITVTIHGATGCPSDSATSAAIVMTVNPLADVLTSVTADHDTVCAGTAIIATAHALAAGTHFIWKVNSTFAGIDDSTFTYTPVAGDIIKCIVTAPVGGCYVANPDSATLSPVVLIATHPLLSVTGNTLLCSGDTATYAVSPLIAGATYTWYNNGLSTGATGTTYNYAPANGDMLKCIAVLPSTGCYTSLADTSNTLTILVNNNVTPAISITTASANVCAGSAATFYSSTPGMSGGSYQWKVNNISVGGSTPTYTYVPVNGDNVACIVTAPASACYTAAADTSNIISITTTALTVPSITISAPAFAVPGSVVTVSAAVADAGSSYLIFWYNNTALFNTSTTPSTTYIKAAGTDNITAKVSGLSVGCYDTTMSAAITVEAVGVGVNDLANAAAIKVYPNPFRQQLTIEGAAEDDNMVLFDAAGRAVNGIPVAREKAKQILHINNLPTGVYMLRIVRSNGVVVKSFIVNKL